MPISKFLNTLYEIISTEDQRIVGWTSDGEAFQVRNVKLLESLILPKYFKHKKMSSFQRQLNYFGFRKWTKTQTKICTFSHPKFLRHSPDCLLSITKKPVASSVPMILRSSQEAHSRKRAADSTIHREQEKIKSPKKEKHNYFQSIDSPINFSTDDLLNVFMQRNPIDDLSLDMDFDLEIGLDYANDALFPMPPQFVF